MFQVDTNSVISKLAACDNLLKDWDLQSMQSAVNDSHKHPPPPPHSHRSSNGQPTTNLEDLRYARSQVSSMMQQAAENGPRGAHDPLLASLHVHFGELLRLENDMKACHAKWRSQVNKIRMELANEGVVHNVFGREGGGLRNYEFEYDPAVHNYLDNEISNGKCDGDVGEGGGEALGSVGRNLQGGSGRVSPDHIQAMRRSLEDKADRQFVELLDEQKNSTEKMNERVKHIEDVAERTLKLISQGHSGVNQGPHHVHEGKGSHHGREGDASQGTHRHSSGAHGHHSHQLDADFLMGNSQSLSSSIARGRRKSSVGGSKSGKLSPAGSETAMKRRNSKARLSGSGATTKGEGASMATSSTKKKKASKKTGIAALAQKAAHPQAKKYVPPSFLQARHFRPGGVAGADGDSNFNRYLGRQLSVNDL